MAVIHKRVAVAVVGATPGHDHGVVVALIAVDHIVVSVHGRCVGDAQRAVRIAGIDHIGTGKDAAAGIDLV